MESLKSNMVELETWIQSLTAHLPEAHWMQALLALGLIVLVSFTIRVAGAYILSAVANRLLTLAGHRNWDRAFRRARSYRYAAITAGWLAVAVMSILLPHYAQLETLLHRVSLALFWIYVIKTLRTVLSAWQETYAATTRAQTRSIKGYLQLGKIVLLGVGAVLVISVLTDRSPILMLSGLGAISAVLMLVFKDTLLSLVASTQLTSNDMLRIGDWIEMPQSNADGFVIDIALHTVKVQNWDKTVTTIPTYKLFSEPYRNWRYMFESGGRRIKRTVRIDATSIRFLTDAECDDLQRFSLLESYLGDKRRAVEQTNLTLGERAHVPANRRRLTNIGTFRAYVLAYLQRHPEIKHHDVITMVRMMEPQSDGVPVEIYCFTALTAWVDYERIQGDIFDHILALLPELGLRLYQTPTGHDMRCMADGISQSQAWRHALHDEQENPA